MPPTKGLLALPPKSAFTPAPKAQRWMQMDPREAQAAQTRQFLGDRQDERKAKRELRVRKQRRSKYPSGASGKATLAPKRLALISPAFPGIPRH